MAEGF